MAVLFTIVGLLLVGAVTIQAQTPPHQEYRYFPETGHVVRGDFLQFFETRGGPEIFGYPLTETFIENGRRVQYFQRARFEFHPENSDPYRVQLGLLAELLGHRTPPIPRSRIPLPNHPDHQYFPETGHTVSHAFLAYYRTHGGLDIFGYPISEFLLESGRIVQYFQRARMEWHPEQPSGQRVRLGNLGEVYIERFRVPQEVLEPVDSSEIPELTQLRPESRSTVTSIRASTTVRYAITGRGGYQTVYVYVTDQQVRPVAGAAVSIEVRFPSGDQVFFLPPTAPNGFAQITFDQGAAIPGKTVVIEVKVTYETLTATTRTSFLPWW